MIRAIERCARSGLRAVAVAAALGALTRPLPAQQAPAPGLPAGPHPVGFTHIVLEPTPTSPRRVTLGAWFPRASMRGAHVPFGSLWELARREDPELPWTAVNANVALQLAMTGDSATSVPGLADVLRWPTLALRDGAVATGQHPLVLWGVRHGTIAAQAEMSALLASHGFVVVTTWSGDAPLAMLWHSQPDSIKRATIEAHTLDLARARQHVARRLNADTTRTTLVAWSYGGQSVSRLSHRVGVRGIISLDANVTGPSAVEEAPASVPLLWMIGRDTARRAWSRRDSLPGDVLALQVPSIAHGNFNVLEGYFPGLLGLPRVQRWSTGGAPATEGYRALLRVVLATLQRWNAPGQDPVAWHAIIEPAADPVAVRIVRR